MIQTLFEIVIFLLITKFITKTVYFVKNIVNYEIDITHLSPMVSDSEILVLELSLTRDFLK